MHLSQETFKKFCENFRQYPSLAFYEEGEYTTIINGPSSSASPSEWRASEKLREMFDQWLKQSIRDTESDYEVKANFVCGTLVVYELRKACEITL